MLTIARYLLTIIYIGNTEKISEHGYKVSISGTGADEIFAGYYDHHNLFLAEIKRKLILQKSKLGEIYQPIVRNPFQKILIYLLKALNLEIIFI